MNETDFNKIIDSINSLTVYREIKNNIAFEKVALK